VWNGLIAKITQGKLAEREVRASREQTGALSSHFQTVEEQESGGGNAG
jgi:hypothetical protein